MAVLICGSLAFDTIMTFEGRFAEQILPDQLHILNVSFLVPSLRRDFGGCAGNIAYSLRLLGGEPLPMAMIGSDGADYLARLNQLGISTAHVGQAHDTYTAQAMIMTDRDNNQITAFPPGAMMQAHANRIEPQAGVRLGIIAPDGRDAMLEHAAQFVAADIPFVFDPGQGLPMFSGAELSRFVEQASWVTVNDYEGKMLCDRTASCLHSHSR
jgi:adenosine kinase